MKIFDINEHLYKNVNYVTNLYFIMWILDKYKQIYFLL